MASSTKTSALARWVHQNERSKRRAITVGAADYVTLLIRANVTDPKTWPKGMKWGAKALARIREIERRCIARHGGFDWEKLSAKLRDEYDGLCARLDEIQDSGERISWEEYITRRQGAGHAR